MMQLTKQMPRQGKAHCDKLKQGRLNDGANVSGQASSSKRRRKCVEDEEDISKSRMVMVHL